MESNIVPALQYMVTVVVSSYNHEKYIAKTIEGILMQKTNFAIQVLVHDDASTDNTQSIIQFYLDKFPNIIFPIFQTENQYSKGIKPWFTYLFPKAQGKYIALCEGDDYWTDPYKLQKQVDFLEANPEYSLCFHEVNVRNQTKDVLEGKYSQLEKFDFYTEDLFDKHFIATCSIVFRNNLIFPVWYNKIDSGDKLLIFLCSLKGKIKFLNDNMGVYRLHPAGISNTHYGINKVYGMSVFLQLINQHTDYKYSYLCKKSLHHEIITHLIPKNNNGFSLSDFTFTQLFSEIFKRIKNKLRL